MCIYIYIRIYNIERETQREGDRQRERERERVSGIHESQQLTSPTGFLSLKLPHRLRLQLVTFKNQRFPHAKMLIPDQKASQQTSTEEHHTINAGVEPPAVEFLELHCVA